MSGKRVRNFAGSGSLESGCGCPSNATIASRRSSARFEISLMKVSLAVAALFGLLVQDTPRYAPDGTNYSMLKESRFGFRH